MCVSDSTPLHGVMTIAKLIYTCLSISYFSLLQSFNQNANVLKFFKEEFAKRWNAWLLTKRNSQRNNLQIGDEDIRQVDKYKYVESVLTSNGNCDSKIQRHIRISKRACQNKKKLKK